MREVIHGIDAPLIALMVMGFMKNPVQGRVPHVYIRRSHVYFCTQRPASVGKLAVFHALEKVKVFLNASVAVRAVDAGLGKRAAVFPYLVLVKVADIRFALLDKLNGIFIAGIEIVASVAELIPVEAKPANILLDCVNKLHILLSRVCVVKSEITAASEPLGNRKINTQSLGVTDMKITVGFGRKTGLDCGVGACVFQHEFLYKIAGFKVIIHS